MGLLPPLLLAGLVFDQGKKINVYSCYLGHPKERFTAHTFGKGLGIVLHVGFNGREQKDKDQLKQVLCLLGTRARRTMSLGLLYCLKPVLLLVHSLW